MVSVGILIIALVIASVSDIKKRVIPDSVHLLLLLSGLISVFVYLQDWKPRLFGFLVLLIVLLAIGLITGNLGGGDIKMMAFLVISMGFLQALAAIAVGMCLAVAYLSTKRIKKEVPLAPFLSMGCLAVLFFLM